MNPGPVLNCHFCVSQCLFLSHCEILPQPSQAAAFQPAGGQRQMNRSCVCSQFKLYPFSAVQAPAAPTGIPAQHTVHCTAPVETISSQCNATSSAVRSIFCKGTSSSRFFCCCWLQCWCCCWLLSVHLLERGGRVHGLLPLESLLPPANDQLPALLLSTKLWKTYVSSGLMPDNA